MKKKKTGILNTVMFVVALIGVIGLIFQAQDRNKRTSQASSQQPVAKPLTAAEKREKIKQENQRRDTSSLTTFCKNEVKAQLNYPSTADFSWLNTKAQKIDNARYVITSTVEAKNAFGVKSKLFWTCRGESLGGLPENRNSWHITVQLSN